MAFKCTSRFSRQRRVWIFCSTQVRFLSMSETTRAVSYVADDDYKWISLTWNIMKTFPKFYSWDTTTTALYGQSCPLGYFWPWVVHTQVPVPPSKKNVVHGIKAPGVPALGASIGYLAIPCMWLCTSCRVRWCRTNERTCFDLFTPLQTLDLCTNVETINYNSDRNHELYRK